MKSAKTRVVPHLRAGHGPLKTRSVEKDALAEPSSRKAILSVKSPRGSHVATLCPEAVATIGDVKKHLQDFCSIPAQRQQLRLEGRPLADHETLESLFCPTLLRLHLLQTEDHTPGTGQLYVVVELGDGPRFEAFCALQDAMVAASERGFPAAQSVVYCSSRMRALALLHQLCSRGAVAAALHGDLPMGERENLLNAFQSGSLQTLVTTDSITARFLNSMSRPPLIINYDFPADTEEYGRRVFRTGFFTNEALAISLVAPHHLQRLRDVERFYNTKVHELNIEEHCRQVLSETLTTAIRRVSGGPSKQLHQQIVTEMPMDIYMSRRENTRCELAPWPIEH